MNFYCFRKVIFAVCFLPIFLFSGCVKNGAVINDDAEKLSIVCTAFPQYDWVRNIVGENNNIDISLIINNGTESHSYQASAEDVIKISNSDIFIYNGGQSDASFKKVAEQSIRDDCVVIDIMESLHSRLLIEETYQTDHQHPHNDLYDEHIWLSLKNAIEVCRQITDELTKVDPQNSAHYIKNCDKYITSLTELDSRFETLVSVAAHKEIILADRYPFKYLMNDYDLTCYAAFPGCSSDIDASFDTVINLANKIDELGISKIAVTENSASSIADAVINASAKKDIQIVHMNSIQSVSQNDINSGLTYLSAMEQNFEALNSILNDTP